MSRYPVRCICKATAAALTVLLVFTAARVWAAPVRVAILPFEMNAEKDLTFLQAGVLDMLASRLAQRDKVEIVNKHETKAALESVEGFDGESLALLVGGKLQADYVLFGSLTVLGDSVSIDAKMVDVSGQQPPLPFFAQTGSMGEVIPQINQFATNINTTVFNRGVAEPPMAAAPPAAPAPQAGLPTPPAQEAPAYYDPRMHPEKMLEAGRQTETPESAVTQAGQAPNPAFVPAAPATTEATFWKSRNLKSLVTGIEVADVDVDGRMEMIVVTDSQVSIYRIENGRMIKTADAAESSQSTFISVDTADINGNGTPEIYVTSLGSRRTMVDSFVIEYTGGTYATIAKGDNWFYRVARTPDHGTLLLGQRQRLGENSIFNGPINEMRWEGDRLVPGRQVLPGRLANLMGLAYGDITHSGTSVVAAYSNQDRIRLYNGNGDKTWEAAERSGGDMLFFNLPKVSAGQPNKQFFPLRIRITDIDRDGKVELMIAHHDELANSMLASFRNFKNAKIASVEWNGLGLVPKWETQQLSGRISDFAVGDVDNDGADELLIALVVKEGAAIFTDSISSLIAFDLNP